MSEYPVFTFTCKKLKKQNAFWHSGILVGKSGKSFGNWHQNSFLCDVLFDVKSLIFISGYKKNNHVATQKSVITKSHAQLKLSVLLTQRYQKLVSGMFLGAQVLKVGIGECFLA